MIRHLLRDFKPSAIAQVVSNAGRSKRMTAGGRVDAGGTNSPSNHAIHINPAHGIARQLSGATDAGPKQISLGILGNASAGKVTVRYSSGLWLHGI